MTRVQIENAPNYDAGLLKMAPGGALVQSLTNTVARTDTSAKTLFTLPAGATILFWTVHAPAVSDAATTALLVVGKSGDADFFLDDINLKVVTGFMVPNNNAAEGAAVVASSTGAVGTADVAVTGTYTETGTASTVGGPWTVTCCFTVAG